MDSEQDYSYKDATIQSAWQVPALCHTVFSLEIANQVVQGCKLP